MAAVTTYVSLGLSVLLAFLPEALASWIGASPAYFLRGLACPVFFVAFAASAYFLGVLRYPPGEHLEDEASPRRPARFGDGGTFRLMSAVVCAIVVAAALLTAVLTILVALIGPLR